METELADIGAVGDGEMRSNLASVVAESGEADALEEDLEGDLGVESERRLMDGWSQVRSTGTVKEVIRATHAVEGGGIEGGVDVVGTGNGVGSEDGDDLEGREATGIVETLENSRDVVGRQGDETLDSRGSRILATSKELETGCTLSFAQAVLALGEVTGERIILTGQLVIATAPAN